MFFNHSDTKLLAATIIHPLRGLQRSKPDNSLFEFAIHVNVTA
ncbi:MAG: hypothetical protein OFPII_37270 [Osedax symbiont Rs1]|nr:MAG: hypothetical protein OFPII_37270 [Osedax symbiont Rs1]